MNRERYSVRLDGNRFFFGLFGPISFWNVFDYFVPCCGLRDGGGRRDILYELQIWESQKWRIGGKQGICDVESIWRWKKDLDDFLQRILRMKEEDEIRKSAKGYGF